LTQPTIRPPQPCKLCENDVMAGCDAKETLLAMDVTAGATTNCDATGGPPTEEYPARVKPLPAKQSSEEIARHEASHCPYRSWRSACVAASAREEPHPKRRREADEPGHPLVSLDYEMLEEKITVLVAKDEATGAVLAYEWAQRRLGCQAARARSGGLGAPRRPPPD
jgi:hypothetical protein